jgi:hypothetical protein
MISVGIGEECWEAADSAGISMSRRTRLRARPHNFGQQREQQSDVREHNRVEAHFSISYLKRSFR